jgi:hypothetical protein
MIDLIGALIGLAAIEAGVLYCCCLGLSWGNGVPPLQIIPKWLLYLVPVNLLILWLQNLVASQAYMFFYRSKGQGKNRYSRERSMAVNGERDQALLRLEKAVKRHGDFEALRNLIDIATDHPVLHTWISKGQVLRGRVKNLSPEDHLHLDNMLGRVVRKKKEEESFI